MIEKVMQEKDAYNNSISSKLFEDILKASPNLKETSLNPSQKFKSISNDICVPCSKTFETDIHFEIRLESSFHLLKITWKIRKEDISCPFIRKCVLEFIGFDNIIMLEATSGKINGVLLVSTILNDDDNEKQKGRHLTELFGKSIHHSSIISEDHGVDEKFGCSQLSENLQYEIIEHSKKGCANPKQTACHKTVARPEIKS